MAIYTPALMLQDGGALAGSIGYAPAVVYIVVKCVIAIGLWGIAVIGWLHHNLAIWERVLAAVAAFTLIAAMPMTDEIGLVLAAIFAFLSWRKSRR